MAKINIVIGDTDELYLNSIVNYIVEHNNNFDVLSFTVKESMLKYIENRANKIDIIAISDDMTDEKILQSKIPAKILLSDGSYFEDDNYDTVSKYQKAEAFLNQILMIYAEKTGRADVVIDGGKSTAVVGFYSPVGGCGKTTLAIASAVMLAGRGKRVFYLNMEKINSAVGIINGTQVGTMSDVYLAKKTRGANVGLRIIANKQVLPILGFNYINPAESSLEINELSAEEIVSLIRDFKQLGEFDYVFVDFDGELSNEKIIELGVCDKIVAPFSPEQTAVSKMMSFAKELSMHEELADLENKIMLVFNKVTPGRQIPQIQEHDVAAIVPISPIMSDIRSGLSSPEHFSSILNDLVTLL